MQPDKAQDFSALRWVRTPLEDSIRRARRALEDHAEGEGADEGMTECADALHQINGVLQMVQVYGGAMLVDEMEQVARAIAAKQIGREHEAIEALVLGLVQLPSYLERIEMGEPDIPLILLPLLNDLRASRDAPLVSEISLFAPKLGQLIGGEAVIAGSGNPELGQLVRGRRADFHRGLLHWYRNRQPEDGLRQIRGFIEAINSQAGTSRLRRLLDAANGLIVAIQEGTLETSIAVKLIFGRLDRFLKRVIDDGEEAAVEAFPLELLKNLLYYVALSTSESPAVEAVRQSADLVNSFPVHELSDLETESVGGAGRELFQAVGDALREDLRSVKDDLDLYMRGDGQDMSRLSAMVVPLQRAGDTLGMIGRGELRARLKDACERLDDWVGTGSKPTEDELLTVASDILRVESALSGLSPAAGDKAELGLAAGDELSAGELQGHIAAAVREAFVDLAKVKDAISNYLEAPDNSALLAKAPGRLHGVVGALRILEQGDAADQLAQMDAYLAGVVRGDLPAPDASQRDALAEIVTGVEYFLEAVQEGRPGRQEIIDFARDAVDRLRVGDLVQALPKTEEPVASAPEPIPAPSEVKPALEDIDPEILDIFLEEAQEELSRIQELYPQWRQQPDDEETLQVIRRSFHTLKGSGRLVGAATIGEFSWAIENLFNRAIDGTIRLDDKVFALLDEAVEMLPQLVAAQASGTVPEADHAALEARAFALASGMPAKPTAQPEAKPVETEAEQGAAEEVIERAAKEALEPESEKIEEAPEPETEKIEEAAKAGADDLAESLEETLADIDEVDLSDLEMESIQLGQPFDTLEDELLEVTLDQDSLPIELDAIPQQVEEEVASEMIDLVAEPASVVETEGEPGPEAEASVERGAEISAQDLGEAPIELEQALFEIFSNEAQSHLQVVREFIDHCTAAGGSCELTEDLSRALHTLRGSAHMAEVEPVAELAGAFENHVNLLRQQGKRADSALIDLLKWAHADLSAVVAAINVPGAELPEWTGLRDEVVGLTQRLAEQQVAPADAEEAGAVDDELVEIFLEEARELLEQLENAFGRWASPQGDSEAVAELQRALHTFKGGARLAGQMPLGDLSHALESLFDALVEARVHANDDVRELVRLGLDRLAAETDKLQQSQSLGDPSLLVDELEAAARGELAAPAAEPGIEQPAVPEAEAGEEVEAKISEPLSEPMMDESILLEETSGLTSEEGDSSLLTDSTLLNDSQLLTDSELLGDTQYFEDSQIVVDEGTGDSRLIRFQGSELSDEAREPRQPPPELPEEAPVISPQEQVRVRSDLLDQMVNNSGEVSIYRARMEQQNISLGYNLQELNGTIARLRDQLRQLELETEAQILARFEREREEQEAVDEDFDPLEMDRYSTIQQLSRSLVETVTDLTSIGESLEDLNRDTDTLLLQQARVTTDLQEGLLRTRMVPFETQVARLQRVVRQTAQGMGKQAELSVSGAEGEMDRSILNRMLGPLEHLLRNAVAHGIEPLPGRRASGKPDTGRITLAVSRDGADVLLKVRDDGAGMDLDGIRERAIQKGLLDPKAQVDDEDLQQFVLEPGFSTAEEVTQVAGRGVGMDVVLSEVKQLGGSLDLHSETGRGVEIAIRLPFTLAITEALLVTVGEDVYAVPHTNIDSVVRISRDELLACYEGRQESFEYRGRDYLVRYLGAFLEVGAPLLPEGQKWFPLLLARSGEHRVAVHVDNLLGNRQIVMKSIGVQLSTVRAVSGGTILADGRVALILDINGLVRLDSTQQLAPVETVEEAAETEGVTVMVVDDSITVRKVTSRLLERHNMHVITAKDGVDAVAMLQEHHPDVMLLDIEMPRMDGFELARHMRNTSTLAEIPIIMITSRTGEKHRQRAMELGVQRYLGKPYQESELLDNIYTVLAETST